jgi:predicted DNA-binding transcriptional regulator AlpA
MAYAKNYQNFNSVEQLPAVLRVRDLANFLGISLTGAYELTRREGFPAIQVTKKRIIVPRNALEKWLEQAANNKE